MRRDEQLSIPAEFDYAAVNGLSAELRQKLEHARPANLGQAAKIEGMTPAALALLLSWLRRRTMQETQHDAVGQSPLNVSRETWERLQTYVDLVRKWNPRINLVSKSSLDRIWQRHIADSIETVQSAGDRGDGHWVDLGSGGGFPGWSARSWPPRQIQID